MDLKKIENSTIYEFKSTGKLTEQDAQNLAQSFKEFERNGEKIKLLGTIEKMPFPKDFSTFDNVFDLKTSSFNVIEKYAILSDKDWVENFVPIGNFFSPGIPIKTFEVENRQEAIDWLHEDNTKEYKPEDYLSNIDIKKIGQNSYEINIPHKKVNHAAMAAFHSIIKNTGDNGKLNILVIFESFPSFDSFKALMEGIKIDFKAIGKIKKYAVVSDAKWIETATKVGDFVTPGLDMEFFPTSELDKAKSWILND